MKTNFIFIFFALNSIFHSLVVVVNGVTVKVRIDTDWLNLPEFSEILEPKVTDEQLESQIDVFRKNRFHVEIYKAGVPYSQEDTKIGIAEDGGDEFTFENIPESWFEERGNPPGQGVILEIRLPRIISFSMASRGGGMKHFAPRYRRPFHLVVGETERIFSILDFNSTHGRRPELEEVQSDDDDDGKGKQPLAEPPWPPKTTEEFNAEFCKIRESEAMAAQKYNHIKLECKIFHVLTLARRGRLIRMFIGNPPPGTQSSELVEKIREQMVLVNQLAKAIMETLDVEKMLFREKSTLQTQSRTNSPSSSTTQNQSPRSQMRAVVPFAPMPPHQRQALRASLLGLNNSQRPQGVPTARVVSARMRDGNREIVIARAFLSPGALNNMQPQPQQQGIERRISLQITDPQEGTLLIRGPEAMVGRLTQPPAAATVQQRNQNANSPTAAQIADIFTVLSIDDIVRLATRSARTRAEKRTREDEAGPSNDQTRQRVMNED